MAWITVTRVKLKSFFHFFPFLLSNESALNTLYRTDGYINGKELIDKNGVFWTMTLWENYENIKSFKTSKEHISSMQKVSDWCCEGSFFGWEIAEANFPSWRDASEQLIKHGKLMPVLNPTVRHKNHAFPPVQWTLLERKLRKGKNKSQ